MAAPADTLPTPEPVTSSGGWLEWARPAWMRWPSAAGVVETVVGAAVAKADEVATELEEVRSSPVAPAASNDDSGVVVAEVHPNRWAGFWVSGREEEIEAAPDSGSNTDVETGV